MLEEEVPCDKESNHRSITGFRGQADNAKRSTPYTQRNLHLFRWDREQVFAARTAREPFCGGGRFGDVNGGWFRASSARWRMRTVARRAPSCLTSDGSRSRWCGVERLLDVYCPPPGADVSRKDRPSFSERKCLAVCLPRGPT